jgi:hypothetical protein
MSVAVLSGCAADLITYKPDAGQNVAYNQGVGSITYDGTDASLMMYPTFRYQSGSDLPTFTLMVQDKDGTPLDFDPQGARAFVDNGRQCHVYTLEERVAEIRRQKRSRPRREFSNTTRFLPAPLWLVRLCSSRTYRNSVGWNCKYLSVAMSGRLHL